MGVKKQDNKAKNFWEDPAFYFLVGFVLLVSLGDILRYFGVNISEEESNSIIGSVILFSIGL